VSLVRRSGALAVALLCAVACGAKPAPVREPPPARAAPRLHEGPLTDYIPAAGLRWMVVGRPRALARHASLAPALSLLLPRERLDAFAAGSGLDLRETEHALAAGFDYATLYAVEPPEPAKIEARFRERLVSEPVEAHPHPEITRLSGLVGRTPQTLVRVDQRLIAVSVGSATPARVVELFARGKLQKTRPALSGSALSTLPRDLDRAPMRFYAPGPFGAEWTRGARGLLAAATAVAIVASPLPDGRLEARILVAGDWSASGAEQALRAGWDDLAQSGTGRLLGLNEPVRGPSIELGPNLLELRVELEALTLARGLRAAVEADVWEILDISRPR
jgi:hypothetical protein